MLSYLKRKIIWFLAEVIEQFGSKSINLIESEREVRELLKEIPSGRLEHYGFKVYSQNEEDGIIREIFNRIGIENNTFVEFGVGHGNENNTAFLLRQGWKGLWIDGNPVSCKTIRKNYKVVIDSNMLTLHNSLVDCNNINSLIGGTFEGEIDLLSVDIDGNDLHVLKAINCINPRVIVAEYNAKFPPPTKWCLPYDASYVWDGTDNQGMSLQSIDDLAKELGYELVATNITGSNAFYVRKDLLKSSDGKELFPFPHDTETLYNRPRYFLKFHSGHPGGRYIPSCD
ncbi:MAG: hypothetical protein JXR78_04445 [Victivallales bacterium]|nr:hypothetical protein [Victivallales bacterium]